MFAMVPYLQAVDGVLPQDVAAGTGNRQRAQVGVGNPHGKGGVLLAQAVTSCGRTPSIALRYGTTEKSLNDSLHNNLMLRR